MHTRVIILAAGKGTRMGADVPKPLVEVAGRPMIEHLLESIEESGIDERPIVVVSPDSIEHFGTVCRDKRCEYAVQEEQLGTGHAAMSAREAANGAERVIVLNGDHPFISQELLESLAALFDEQKPSIAMATTKVPNFKDDYSMFERWGRIVRDEVGRVMAIREAKDASEEELEIKELNTNIYLFDADWLWDHLPEIQDKNASKEYYITDLVEIAIEEGADVVTVQAEPFEVMGINTPDDLERAERLLG